MQARKATLLLTSLLLIAALPLLPQSPTLAQETSHTFPETGKTVRGIFLQYWHSHGALAQQGYPISDEMMLKSTDGKEYRTQFFQRAVFEHHPEFAGTPNEVLLKLVGQTFYERHFQSNPPPNQAVNPTNTITFKETGHGIGGKFRDYWEKHGGLAQQGYPMMGEFKMVSTDGKEYTTQVFQRAVFELHPEFAGTENEVLLRLLGVEEWEETQKAETAAKASPTPVATATSTRGGQNVPPENAALYVPYDGGVIVEAKGGGGDIVANATNPNSTVEESKQNLAKLINDLHRKVGLNESEGLLFDWMANGDQLANISNYQGANVYHDMLNIADDLAIPVHIYRANGKVGFQFTPGDAQKFNDALSKDRKKTRTLLTRVLLKAYATGLGKREMITLNDLKLKLDPSLWYLVGFDGDNERYDHSPLDYQTIL